MASTFRTCDITSGPSKWDLLIRGLAENKEVEFTASGGLVVAYVHSVERLVMSEFIEDWRVRGVAKFVAVIIGHDLSSCRLRFRCRFSTKRRVGTMEISCRCGKALI